ncbi:ribosome biogenesis protein WDR12 homolog isoform X2 [Ahaetulla prasina]|uniref:ribosome biogenesis protein WDR12 homolog isoform X2 n=1 Tax=Ahaetulla prasina TaxID=499056 RepID=UPI002648BBCE|nr:ribosome biogenesis protein WDR12 homolog isoform X2 [Ahaetulla prasina]
MAAEARKVPLGREAHGVYSLCFGASDAQLAAGFGDGAVQVAGPGGGRPERGPPPPELTQLSPQLVDAETGAPGPCLRPGRRPRQAVTALGFHRAKPGLLLAAGADGVVVFYDLRAGSASASLTEEENEIHALDFCRDGSAFATAGKDRHIRLYDSHTHQLVHVVRAPDFMAGDEFTPFSGHSRRIFALRFHPSELHLFLTGGWDNSVKVWDKRVPKGAQSVINGPHICGPGIDIKGEHILTASWVPHNALQLWDLRMSRLWQNVPFPGNPTQGEFLYSAQFCTEDVVVAGGSGTSGAGIIHTGTGQVIREVLLSNKPVHAVASASKGQPVAVAGAGGNLYLAELH